MRVTCARDQDYLARLDQRLPALLASQVWHAERDQPMGVEFGVMLACLCMLVLGSVPEQCAGDRAWKPSVCRQWGQLLRAGGSVLCSHKLRAPSPSPRAAGLQAGHPALAPPDVQDPLAEISLCVQASSAPLAAGSRLSSLTGR